MSDLLFPEGYNDSSNNQDDEMKLNYDPSEEDEECFFLGLHMHIPPSESYAMNPERRKWFIARFIHQKQMEQTAYEQAMIKQQLGNNLKF